MPVPFAQLVRWFAPAVLVACLLTLPGCAGDDNVVGPKNPARDPVPSIAYPKITLQGELDYQLVLLGEPVVVGATPTQPMSVRLRLRNATEDDLYVAYRYRFFGPSREPVDVDMPWRPLKLPATLAKDFEGDAMQVRAVDWELEVRPD